MHRTSAHFTNSMLSLFFNQRYVYRCCCCCFSLFYFPFCSIHVQTNTIMILAIAKTNRNRSSNLSHIDTHSHTGTYKHRSTHITTCTYRHIYTHIPLPHIHIHNECTIYHCWVYTSQTSRSEKTCKCTHRSIYNAHTHIIIV